MTSNPAGRAAIASLLLVTVLIIVPSSPSAVPQEPQQRTRILSTTQRIYAPLPKGGWLDAEVVLNNNSPDPMSIRPVFYRMGMAAAGTPITLQPAEVRWMRLSELNQPTGADVITNDAVELEYLGRKLEVGAQVTLIRQTQTGSVDVPFSARADYRSAVQEAVWFLPPAAQSVVVLGNASGLPVSVGIKRGGRAAEQLEIGPHETRTLISPSTQDGARQLQQANVDSMRLEVAGEVGSLRATGFVELRGKFIGGIRFYDPSTGQQSDIFATNLRIADKWPAMVLKNTSDTSITATPRFLPLQDSGGPPIELAPTVLGPRAAVVVDLSELLKASAGRPDFSRGSVQVVNTGRPGSLIGGLSAVDRRGVQAFDVPLREPGMINQSTGSYPWRIDGDYNTIVTIMNVAATPATFVVKITYPGGSLQPAPQHLDVGKTATFDMRQLRDGTSGLAKGFPSTVTSGQFRWSMVHSGSETKLNGRAEIVSVSEGRTSSYSCAECCPWSHGGGWLDPNGLYLQVGASNNTGVLEGFWDCWGGYHAPYAAWASGWNVDSPSVTSMSTVDWGVARADGWSEGSTNATGTWDADSWDWDYNIEVCVYQGLVAYAPGNVVVACDRPTTFYEDSHWEAPAGVLNFRYRWNSTSFNVANLTTCTLWEELTDTPSPWPSPPFSARNGGPPATRQYQMANGTAGLLEDGHWPGGTFVTPYGSAMATTSQRYFYRCSCEGNLTQYIWGPQNIVRSIASNGTGGWKYTITKTGQSATINPLP